MPASSPSRSSALPGMAAACAANGTTSCEDSAISMMLTKASTMIVPQMNSVGRSTATAPSAATCPGLPSPKTELDAAAPGPGHERLHQHPGHGHAEDQQHRRELAVLDVRRGDGGGHGEDPGHRAPPFCWGAAAGCGGTGSVECTWTRVWCTAGLMTLSTGWG